MGWQVVEELQVFLFVDFHLGSRKRGLWRQIFSKECLKQMNTIRGHSHSVRLPQKQALTFY